VCVCVCKSETCCVDAVPVPNIYIHRKREIDRARERACKRKAAA
jgi:hypothetical protein